MASATIIIKKRSRPTSRVRERSVEPEPDVTQSAPAEEDGDEDEDKNLPCVTFSVPTTNRHFTHSRSLDELLELRRLRRARQGIDVTKLNKGEPRKRKKAAEDGATTTPTGLIKGVNKELQEEE